MFYVSLVILLYNSSDRIVLSEMQLSDCPEVGPTPHQPKNITFPKVLFGKAEIALRSFNSSWFSKWEWLHWDERVFCFTCVSAFKQKKLRSATADIAFISRGWKDATAAFHKHESSSCHKQAEQMIVLPATNRDIGECLSTSLALENRACFLKLLGSVRFLARQGLALRGDGIGEPDSNCMY